MNSLTNLTPDKFVAPNAPGFLSLPEDVRNLVCERLAALKRILSAKKRGAAIREVASEHGGDRGWSVGRLRTLCYDFIRTDGDWTVLVDRARAGRRWFKNLQLEGIPEAFAEYLGQMCCANQRNKFRPFYLHTLIPRYRRWLNGDAAAALPGYLACPKPNGKGVPEGWTEGNLRRIGNRVASDYSRKLIQIGPKAASQLSAPILTTREGIEAGQVYVFDDSKNDFKVLFRGRACDLWSLHALDLASGCNVMRGYKPSLNDEGAREHIREREMLFLVVALGTTIGFCPRGAVLVCEKGTATIRRRDEEILHYIWPEFFDVQRGPAGGGPGISALLTGPEGGNPRWKAPLESWHNIIRNASGSMLDFPGQTGSLARVNDPEGIERLAAMDEALYRAAQLLPPERAQQLQFGLMSSFDALAALDALIEVINTRRDHNLEGWRRCGHFIQAFRMAAHLPPIASSCLPSLPAALQQQIQVNIAANPRLLCELALSPREVFTAGTAKTKFRKFTPGQASMLLGAVEGDERPVKNGLLAVNVPEVEPDEPLRYGPLLRDLNGGDLALRNGDKYCVRVNPLMPEAAFVYDSRGGFLGLAPVWGRVGRLDQEGLQRAFATKRKALAHWTAQARQLAAPLTARADAIAKHNNAVIAGAAAAAALMDEETDAALGAAVKL